MTQGAPSALEVAVVEGAPAPAAALVRLCAGLGDAHRTCGLEGRDQEPGPDAQHAGRPATHELRPVLLHSSGGAPARFSWLAWSPRLRVEWRGERGAVWQRFAALLAELAREPAPALHGAPLPGPLTGGFLGALSYDLHAPGAALDIPADLPPDDAAPLIVGGVYDRLLVWDHAAGTCTLVLPADVASEEAPRVRRALANASTPEPPPAGLRFTRETPAAAHRDGVTAVQAAILEGELYQANLSHRLRGALDARAWPPAAAYAALAAANPVPYAGFLEWSGGALLSASPELLVECDARPAAGAERRARTRPIKGTAPRGATPAEDARLAAALLASAKDAAELAMIVDLERNDLGRVAAFRADRAPTVRVPAARRLEPYASVQHLVADVECDLRPGCSEAELLAAVFPGGSITGAPKLRSMELIAALEGRARSFFTGSLGFVDRGGALAFNILIRTLIWNTRTGAASLRVGGGVTWASVPADEDAETLHKAASLLAGLGIELDEGV